MYKFIRTGRKLVPCLDSLRLFVRELRITSTNLLRALTRLKKLSVLNTVLAGVPEERSTRLRWRYKIALEGARESLGGTVTVPLPLKTTP